MIFQRVLAVLCPFVVYYRNLAKVFPKSSPRHKYNGLHLEQAIHRFCNHTSPEHMQYLSCINFRCWSMSDDRFKSGITDTDFAAYLDEVNHLAKAVHQHYNSSHHIPKSG
jgi:hypothetical protein